MDSPSAQLFEQSMLDFDHPPSSPFMSETGPESRSPSKQWESHPLNNTAEVELSSATKGKVQSHDLFLIDKENIPVNDIVDQKPHNPWNPNTPETPAGSGETRRCSEDLDIMPLPSSRRSQASSHRTPSQSKRGEVATPRTVTRTPLQHASAFKAGMDIRHPPAHVEDQTSIDDTCFSTFSAIPDMTVFAKLGQSPAKELGLHVTPGRTLASTPRNSRKRSSLSRSPSPTPRRQKTPAASSKDETTSFLIDFTQQIEHGANYRQRSPIKSSTDSDLLQYINHQRSPSKPGTRGSYVTPGKPNHLLNLLDFELPPAPTPRSVPTITIRELECLKSTYLSQISSLKATLSGREAEVESLKKAVGDAERRVGEAQEQLRGERCKCEQYEQEIMDWKTRGKEFESVLRNVREEVLKADAETEETMRRLDEADKRAEEAEARASKAEERFADALAARTGTNDGDGNPTDEQVQRLVSVQIDAKIEAVSRELHAVYKEKHERKVATLKKSYEARNENKTAELQNRVTDLERQNEELIAAQNATFPGPLNDSSMVTSGENADLKAQINEQKAVLARLESEMQVSKSQQDQLMRELQQERIEKGDLVAAVDEMLALQADAPPTPGGARAMSVVEDFRKSISRPQVPPPLSSGLAGFEMSKIGRAIPHPSAPASLNRSTSGGIGKSRILANIERMGRTGSSQSNH